MKLIINLPAFNEAEKIGETIKRIPRTFEGIDEVLIQVIDDGSTDDTLRIARESGADVLYTNGVNRGLGKTFRHGVDRALENGADIMVNMDPDGQFNPLDIPKLIAPILSHQYDMVSADRFGDHAAKNMPFIKKFLNQVAARIIGWFMNAPIKDLTCGYRAYSRETLLRLNLLGDFTYTQETIIDALGKHLKLTWIPVEVTYFAERKSKMTRSIWKYIQNSTRLILKAVRDVRPMKFFGIPGFILMFIAFGAFLYFLGFYFQDFKISPYRNILFFAATAFMIGLQFMVLAFIADMIKSNRRLSEDMLYLTKKNMYRRK